MAPLDALKMMVKHYPGGHEVVAVRLGKTSEVLRKELAGAPGFKLGLNSALLINDLCIEAKSEHHMAFINSVTAHSGGYVQLPVIEMREPISLQRSMSDVIREMSDVSVATIEGDADGVISDNDLKRSMKEIEEARQALQRHEQAILSKHAAGKERAPQ